MSLLKRIESRQTGGSGEGSQKPPSGSDSSNADQEPYDPFNGHIAIYAKVLARLDPSFDSRDPHARRTVEDLLKTIVQEDSIALSQSEQEALSTAIVAEIVGFGPLEALLDDDDVTEIMVNGSQDVYLVRKGRLRHSNIRFENDAHVVKILNRLLESVGQPLDAKTHIVDILLPNRVRLNAVLAPIALSGTTLTIRKFGKQMLRAENLIRFATMTEQVAEFLRACVIARLNIVVSGHAGSGKTTMLNVLSGFIPNDERIITIETVRTLELRQEHVISLATHPLGFAINDGPTYSDLVRNVQHMHADRIVIDDVRAGEALDIVQAMNWGYDGLLIAVNSSSPRDALARLEVMCLMSGIDLPVRAIREQLASAVNLIVQVERLRDGTRKIVKVTEIQGLEGDVIALSDIFEFEKTGIEVGRVIGRIRPTGWRPKCLDQIEAAGLHLPPTAPEVGIGLDTSLTPSQQTDSASDEQTPATDG